MTVEEGTREFDHGTRRLQSAMLEHPNFAIERMPGLSYALNRFIAEAPTRLSSLAAPPSGGAIGDIQTTTLFQAIGDCSGLTAAIYESAEPEAQLMIALDERIDELIISSIFGEALSADSPDKHGEEAKRHRTAIEAALLEAFARALGEALEAAFAPVARVVLSFERLVTLKDMFALGRRDGEAAMAQFSLNMNKGVCDCLPFAAAAVPPACSRRAGARSRSRGAACGSALVSADGSRRSTDAAASNCCLGGSSDSLGDVANFEVGGLLPLQCNDFTAIRLECSGRAMFTCKLGQADGRYRLEVESPIAQRQEASGP